MISQINITSAGAVDREFVYIVGPAGWWAEVAGWPGGKDGRAPWSGGRGRPGAAGRPGGGRGLPKDPKGSPKGSRKEARSRQ